MKAIERNIARHENGVLYFVARRGAAFRQFLTAPGLRRRKSPRSGVAAIDFPAGMMEVYGTSRISCSPCNPSTAQDQLTGLRPPTSREAYRKLCELEIKSVFAFQIN